VNRDENWTLRGVKSVDGGSSVWIREGRIAATPSPDARVLDLPGCVALPGRINAHDHLEFALFPRLGAGPWPNAKTWAEAVYRPDASPVREHLRVAKADRLLWGGLRNLLGGVTTVCHHNPPQPALFTKDFPVRVLERYGWAHSPAFEPDLAARRRATPQGAPFLLHLGEGTDEASRREIFDLDRAGLLDAQTVVVHGVGLDAEGLELLARRGGALVWCPSSNLFTLGRTLDVDALPAGLPVALGTDSPLTGAGDWSDEAALAGEQRARVLSGGAAARVLRIDDGRETGAAGAPADVIVLQESRLVAAFVGGRLKLAAEEIGVALRGRIEYDGRRYRVDADVEALFERTAAALGDEIRLSGKPVRPW